MKATNIAKMKISRVIVVKERVLSRMAPKLLTCGEGVTTELIINNEKRLA